MKLSDFDFALPRRLIAQTPARPRDHARLLIYDRKSGSIKHDRFFNLADQLPPDTTLVLNDSKVEKSRLRFGAAEIFVVEAIDRLTIRALVRPGRRFRPGMTAKLQLAEGELYASTLHVDDAGIRTLRLSLPLSHPTLKPHRLTPLPPYIMQDESLGSDYQTVYAQPVGSKAAPTAGLHFTAQQLEALGRTHPVARLTLHVGLGTFLPVKSQDISQHKMHAENFIVPPETATVLNTAETVTAVGTTSLRVLESLKRPYQATAGSTDIFITPGHSFQNVDCLITNFHLPKSTLLMLVAAFIGSVDETMRIYRHAIAQDYRFYSFGDAMLIL